MAQRIWKSYWNFVRRLAADESTFTGASVDTFLARATEVADQCGTPLLLTAAFVLVERDGLDLVAVERGR